MESRPTRAELILLAALWDAGDLSAREIHDATEAKTNWSYSSTRKTLERMEAKSFIAVKPVHRLKVYSPARSKLSMLADLISWFSRDMLGAGGTLPAAAFVKSDLIDADEVDDLQALLDDLAVKNRGGK